MREQSEREKESPADSGQGARSHDPEITLGALTSRASFFLHELGDGDGGSRESKPAFHAPARKRPTWASTSPEAGQVPKGDVKCGACLRHQEEEECLCLKWLSQMLPHLSHGNFFSLSFLAPLQGSSLAQRKPPVVG